MIAEFFLGSARLGSDIFRLRLNKNPARLGSTVLRLSFCGSSFGLQVYPLAFDAPAVTRKVAPVNHGGHASNDENVYLFILLSNAE